MSKNVRLPGTIELQALSHTVLKMRKVQFRGRLTMMRGLHTIVRLPAYSIRVEFLGRRQGSSSNPGRLTMVTHAFFL